MQELGTDRLRLRQWQPQDFDEYAALCADPLVMRYLGGTVLERADAWRHMAMLAGHWQLKGFGHWAVELKQTQAMIGRIGFFEPEGWPGFELGWTIARAHQRQGYASEGAKAALDWAFNHTPQQQVISLIHPENTASKQVALKLGERFWRNAVVKGTNVCVYGIERGEHLNLS
ncbi:GNAT family N-acetyltransferase [uncultured Ferrimonas sp.]|uniref:GNAT family N-acetyltransferase n=1 Tax=uncultured Ferrimonas sp. TaxID=432640 RepID=UPI00262F930B|nr:GNAT family N-acetyltransferase [uncultured Ferrimonas sp.]